MRVNAHLAGSITLLLVILFCMQQCRINEQKKLLNRRVELLTDSLKTFRLKSGKEVAEKKSVELTTAEYKKTLTRADKKELKERVGNVNNLKGRSIVDIKIADTFKAPIIDSVVKGDSVRSFKYTDNFLQFNGIIKKDTIEADYSIKAKLDLVVAKEKNGYKLNVVSDNPKLKITGIQDYRIRDKKYFFQRNGFWLGVGILGTAILLK